MGSTKTLISKLLIVTCIIYHIAVTLTDPMQIKRFEINTVNNMHKYFGKDTTIYNALAPYIQEIILGFMACSVFMLVSRNVVWKLFTLVGIVLYNIFILHFHVIVPNYYMIRDWIAVAAGVLYLIAVDN